MTVEKLDETLGQWKKRRRGVNTALENVSNMMGGESVKNIAHLAGLEMDGEGEGEYVNNK